MERIWCKNDISSSVIFARINFVFIICRKWYTMNNKWWLKTTWFYTVVMNFIKKKILIKQTPNRQNGVSNIETGSKDILNVHILTFILISSISLLITSLHWPPQDILTNRIRLYLLQEYSHLEIEENWTINNLRCTPNWSTPNQI